MKFVLFLVAVALQNEGSGSQLTPEEEYGVQGPLTFLSAESKAADCTGKSGNFCGDEYGDCRKLFVCIPGLGLVEGDCPAGQYCNQDKCSTTPSALCEYENLDFKCNTVGMYPEPSSCKKYNFCLPNAVSPTPGVCETGFAYNVYTTLCDKVLPNNVCTDSSRAVPTCVKVGQNAALKGNAALYYVCLPYSTSNSKLYPHIYKCPGNTKYKGNYICK